MGKMYNLFREFNRRDTMRRVSMKFDAFLSSNVVFKVPGVDSIRDWLVDDFVDYIEEMVRNHGQESKQAAEFVSDNTTSLSLLERAGVIRECWTNAYFRMGAEILFDEMRRCGIGKVEGIFVDDGEE